MLVQSVVPLPNSCNSVSVSFFGKITKFQLCNRCNLICVLSSIVNTIGYKKLVTYKAIVHRLHEVSSQN